MRSPVRTSRRQRRFAWSALFIACCLWPARPGFGEDRLIILAEDDAAPWSYADGTGCANEVVKAAFAAAKVDIDLQIVPYERAKKMVLGGKAVACFSMSWDPSYQGKVVFADKPLFTCQCDYLQSLGRPLAATGEAGITARIVVGIVVGYEYPPSVLRLRDQGLLTLEESPSEDLNLKKLASGRIDAALLNYNRIKTAEMKLTEAEVAGKVGIAFHCGELGAYLGFSVAHPQGAWACQRFNAGFALIQADGTVERIERAWIAKIAAAQASPPAAGGAGK